MWGISTIKRRDKSCKDFEPNLMIGCLEPKNEWEAKRSSDVEGEEDKALEQAL